MDSSTNKQIHINSIDPITYEELRERAKARGLKVSGYAKMILYQHINEVET